MAGGLYLLDTGVLIALANGKDLGRYIDITYGLRASRIKPLACIVSHGELRALARVNGFDEARRNVIEETLDGVVTVDISDELVIESYAEIYESLRHHPKGSRTNVGENDMWIAAATRAAGATLLTTDGDFNPLHPTMLDLIYIPKASRLMPPTSST